MTRAVLAKAAGGFTIAARFRHFDLIEHHIAPPRRHLAKREQSRTASRNRGSSCEHFSPTWHATIRHFPSSPEASRSLRRLGRQQTDCHRSPLLDLLNKLPRSRPVTGDRRRQPFKRVVALPRDHGSTWPQDTQYGAEVHRRCAEEAPSDERHCQA